MPESELLEELTKTLDNIVHKEYVESYIDDKEKGLSSKFDEIVEMNTRET